ncbi:protein prenyltransferase alpha subunit repeat-containing protein 1 [Nilaparvata lugens]|uniref:protein prenyltransferase alpha subunit repeat-containing protein 1 n=1 Tax=Nilaparvata lugens TaxID=108931 RepID=UPI00193E8498|nr:protein prenyltransferase alpha subunit repeat-containing protein 1 [Nilaparvata lugens]
MQEENIFPAAERIISDINSAFKKDPKLKEFDIVAVTLNENKSPVVVENHCLGLESWCVKHVYCHAYSRVMEIRQQKRRKEDPERIENLLTVALLINPDVSSMWNMRRELVMTSHLDANGELLFSSVVLSRKPKSGDVFAYRRWLINNVLMKDCPSNYSYLTDELHISMLAAERYSNNYHAWNHRKWCLGQLLATLDTDSSADLLSSEWSMSRTWIATHVSDYSGFQYRQQVLSKILDICVKRYQKDSEKVLRLFFRPNENGDAENNCDSILDSLDATSKSVLAFLSSELFFNSELILLFPGHEAIWCHRRFVLYTFHKRFLSSSNNSLRRVYCREDGSPLEKELKTEAVAMETSQAETLLRTLVSLERTLCLRCRDDSQQSKAASRHRVWMERVLKIKFS